MDFFLGVQFHFTIGQRKNIFVFTRKRMALKVEYKLIGNVLYFYVFRFKTKLNNIH